MREWNINIYVLGPEGDELPANCFEKVTYYLHPSFPNPTQVFKQPPFRIQEEGWGEFEMNIHLTPIGGGKNSEQKIAHDLNFQSEKYDAIHNITFRNPKPDLVAALRDSGPTGGGDANGVVRTERKRGKKDTKNVDMEKLAEGLQRLGEDDLLHVVQLVHDNKGPETYTKNDVENGEFHVDLYTLPDNLIKMLWDFTGSKVDMAV
ncbi:Ran GTPase binding protein Sbp1 [Elasticomyces elasticus]|nr:Ran GTPase binding protein Sbp1 [Elasticomyces elasticus]